MAETTLILTVFNREKTLDEAIASALPQSRHDFELLVWDDGSADGSLDIARHHAANDPRVRVVAADHRGRVQSLIAAVAESDAPYFGILDSDDRLHPDALAETVPVMAQDPDLAIVYTDRNLIDAEGTVIGRSPSCDIAYSPERLLVDQMVFHFRLFRREIYDEIGGFDPTFECAEDYDLVIRMSEAGDIVHVAKVLYDYRIHDDRLSIEHELEQIEWSRRAVERALERRGVAHRLKLEVRLQARFSLVDRPRRG